jgi:transposase-like protein
MKANIRLLRKNRVYSREYKVHLVSLYEKGRYSVLQLSRLYGVASGVIYRWIYRYSSLNEKGCRIVEMKQSSTKKLKLLEQRVRELEQMVGQKQITIEFLEKMIDIAGQQLNIDIKKKFFTPPSNGSARTGKS